MIYFGMSSHFMASGQMLDTIKVSVSFQINADKETFHPLHNVVPASQSSPPVSL